MLDQINRLREQIATRSQSGIEPDQLLSPRVAVLIPAYKHSVLLAEALESVLAQEAPFDIAAVIIDDGCPYPETGEIGRTYALAHPNVFYLRKANGGLSSMTPHSCRNRSSNAGKRAIHSRPTSPYTSDIFFASGASIWYPVTQSSVLSNHTSPMCGSSHFPPFE